MIDDVYIYKHKSNNKYYVCNSQALNIMEYSSKENGLIFYRAFGRILLLSYASGNVEFSDFTVKSKLLEILQ